MIRTIGNLALGILLVASPAFAGPGDPFGGDDSGCVPLDKPAYSCGAKVAAGLEKLNASVIRCHLVQAGKAFKTSHSSPGFDSAEENCEVGPSNTSAKAKFDALIARYTPVCDPGLIASANARRDVILDDANPASLDQLNGSFFCDATSGLTIAEPGGDDAGFIPADPRAYKCSVGLAKAYSRLLVSVYKCHVRAASSGLAGRSFDEDACEDGAPPLRSARAKYDAYVAKLAGAGVCPACVLANAPALANDLVTGLDAQNGEIFPCPAP